MRAVYKDLIVKIVISRLNSPLLIFVLAFALQNVHASSVIDDFTDFQMAENGSSDTMSILGSDFGGVTRTLVSGSQGTDVAVEGGLLSISNWIGNSGTASVLYSFASSDLDEMADALLFVIDFINVNVNIELVANGNSLFALSNPGAGQYRIAFSQFSNPDEFSHLTSLEFKFHGENAWDSTFTGSLTAVPEPSITALLIIGLLALGHVSTKRAGPAISQSS